MEILTFVRGSLQTNNYLLINGKDAVLIDAAKDSSGDLDSYIGGLNLKAVLLTHGHFDHIDDCKKYQDMGVKIYIHKNDAHMTRSNKNLSLFWARRNVEPFEAETIGEGKLNIDCFDLEVIHTPGHTQGSVCYVDRAQKVIFSGDTLFYRDVGRCDLPGGDFEAIKKSIKKLFALEGDYEVLCGHGRKTTLDFERNYNPYVKL